MSLNEFVVIGIMNNIVFENSFGYFLKGKIAFISKNDINRYIEENIAKYVQQDDISSFIKDLDTEYCFVSIRILAKNNKEALGKAELIFRKVDNALRFSILTREKNWPLGVFDFKNCNDLRFMCIGDNSYASSFKYDGSIAMPIMLGEYLFKEDHGSTRLWELINKSIENKLTTMERSILNAIDWLGRAKNEKNSIVEMFSYITAIEALLNCQDESSDKSVVAQISENFAFVVADTLEKRDKAEKLFKKLYNIRSRIVHGGQPEKIFSEKEIQNICDLYEAIFIMKKVDITDTVADLVEKKLIKKQKLCDECLDVLFGITTVLVIKFLTVTELQNIKTKEELIKYISKLRYT